MATLMPLSKLNSMDTSFLILINLLMVSTATTASFYYSSSSSSTSTSSSSFSASFYHQHCGSIVSEPGDTTATFQLSSTSFPNLWRATFQGADKILGRSPHQYSLLETISVSQTQAEGLLKVHASLSLIKRRYPIIIHDPQPRSRNRFVYRNRALTFDFQGYYSRLSGKLCMVGTGYASSNIANSLSLPAVFKLNYPKVSNISTTIVTGTVESIVEADDPNYFDPVSLVGFCEQSYSSYSYSLILNPESSRGESNEISTESLPLEPNSTACWMLSNKAGNQFELDYGGKCSNCSIFDKSLGYLPNVMTLGGMQCSSNGKMRMYMLFTNSSSVSYRPPFVPETTLIGEGVWDDKKNQLCVVACRLRNFERSLADTKLGDCSIKLSLRFPKVLTIKVRSSVEGSLWSKRQANESGYFDRIEFRSSMNNNRGVLALKYNYTELDHVRNSCPKTNYKDSGKRFPDGHSFQDMRFGVSVETSKVKRGHGSLIPLSVGEVFYEYFYSFSNSTSRAEVKMPMSNHSVLNVSYSIAITLWRLNKSEGMKISAEGIYNAKSGDLCMMGCRSLGLNCRNSTHDARGDCKIFINVKFAPFNSQGAERLKGSIKSTRKRTDPLYFEPMKLFSNVLYSVEISETMSRMDVEIIMVLVSLTLACVFIGLQLYHVKRNPNVLSAMSVTMLAILTLAYMIPLVLNFEAMFSRSHNWQTSLFVAGGWLEGNEVLVRIVTMVSSLLLVRLLQLAFAARLAEDAKKGLCCAENKVVGVCSVLYLAGALIALFVHSKKIEEHGRMRMSTSSSRHSGWVDLRSYGGLIVDGFLLPQILMNLFSDSKEKALSLFFYAGTTIVRLLPHAYDAYRAQQKLPYVDSSYFYGDPGSDLYSTSWDIVIPCGGLLLAIVVCLQQRFGGAFMLPQRYRQSVEYEKVPVDST